jgi:hypothetical protein
MTHPLIGVHQANEPYWGTPPRLHSGDLVHWRGEDGQLTPLTGQAVVRTPPAVPVALRTSVPSVTRPHPAGLVPFEPRPWDDGAGGLVDVLGARLASTEQWAIGNAGAGPLRLAVQPLTWLHEWGETESWLANTVLGALATDANLAEADGAYLALVRTGTNGIALRLSNGVDTPVESVVTGVVTGDRVSVRGVLADDGDGGLFVRTYLVRNGGAESAGAASAAIEAPAVWGDADNARLFLAARQWLRTCRLRAGTIPRATFTSTL